MKHIPIIITSLALALAACNSKQKDPGPVAQPSNDTIVTFTDSEIKTAGITTGKLEKTLVSSTVRVSGLIDVPPQNMVSVSFPMGGYLSSTHLLPGMKIHKGEVLAQMEDPGLIQLQQDYLMARTKAEYLQKDYDRQKLLNVTKASSNKTLEQTEADYRSQKILVGSLQQKLRLVNIDPARLDENNIRRSVPILSPINGYVSAVNINIGKYVNPSDILFDLVNPSNLHLALSVFEKDIPYVAPGQKVKVTLVRDPSKTYSAEVALVSQDLDSERRALVHCHLEGDTKELRPGMFVNATIETKSIEGMTVPEEAIVRWQDKEYIFIQKSRNQFERRPVTTGPVSNGRVEIQLPSADLDTKILIVKNAYAALMKLENRME